MDVYHAFRGTVLCWDPDKAASNLRKHRISFYTACEVFADRMLLVEDATAGEELRSLAIGLTLDWKVTCVVHLEREDGMTRIISAREANPSERTRYENSE